MVPAIDGATTTSEWKEALWARFYTGAWLRFVKKGIAIPSVTAAEALDVALCHGWIDGQAQPWDEGSYLLRFTPRRAKSNWHS